MKILNGMLWAVVLTVSGQQVHAGDVCVGLDKIASEVKTSSLSASVKEAARKIAALPPPAKVECGSLRTVLRELVSGRKTGGRRLEEAKPLDEDAAKKNLQEALTSGEVKEAYTQLQSEVPDADVRQLYEAAVLDAAGFYSARELVVTKASAGGAVK